MDAAKIELVEDGKNLILKVHNCRALYAHVNSPRLDKEGKPQEYSMEILVPKTCPGIEDVKTRIRTMGVQKFGGPGWKCPILKDGDKEFERFIEEGGKPDDAMKLLWKGHYIISGNSKMRDRDTGVLIKPLSKGLLYSGCYASAKFNVKSYDFPDDKGVRCFGVKGYFEGAVFKGDGERLGRFSSIDDLGDSAESSSQETTDDYPEPPITGGATEPDPW